MSHRGLVALISIAFAASPVRAQVRDTGEPVSLPFSRTYAVTSTVTGHEYRLLVVTPAGYTSTGGDSTRYPVLYMGDGNISSPLAWYLHRAGAGDVRPVILVGIGYPPGELGFRRAEESTPTSMADFDTTFMAPRVLQTGGAPGFIRMLREEAIPFIERTYRVTEERAFIGVSISGLFAAYGLFEDPGLFRHWVLGSPSLWWDDGWALRREAEYARTHTDLAASVYIWVGAAADITNSATHFAEQLRLREYPSLQVTNGIVPGGTHETSWHDALHLALKTIFAAPSPGR